LYYVISHKLRVQSYGRELLRQRCKILLPRVA
jgi:hypothetical protein